MEALPYFRKAAEGFNTFVEGWALCTGEALLTVALLTVALLAMALLTVALLAMALLAMALLAMALLATGGPSTRRSWRASSASSRPSRTALRATTCSATSATSSCAPRGWWSTRGCTISAGLVSRPSRTWRTTLTYPYSPLQPPTHPLHTLQPLTTPYKPLQTLIGDRVHGGPHDPRPVGCGHRGGAL